MNMTLLYKHNAIHARAHNELETYRASMKANIAWKKAIEAAIRTHFDRMHLSKTAVSEVVEAFGKERVSYVLANSVQQKEWDERFSRSNKEWAQQFEIEGAMKPEYDSRYQFVVQSHPAVLDGFVSAFRREYALEQESPKTKRSLDDRLKAAHMQKRPQAPSNPAKHKEPEL